MTMAPGVWFFWAATAMFVWCTGMSLRSLRQGPWRYGVGHLVAAALQLAAMGIWFDRLGVCVLPYPKVVEFRQGMTLCPHQSAKLTIPILAPAAKRATKGI